MAQNIPLQEFQSENGHQYVASPTGYYLQRMTSEEEREDRRKMWDIFNLVCLLIEFC